MSDSTIATAQSLQTKRLGVFRLGVLTSMPSFAPSLQDIQCLDEALNGFFAGAVASISAMLFGSVERL